MKSIVELQKKLEEHKIDVLFTDYYDTLVHRNVHPNSVLRIWSKIMIKELGLDISIDYLYFAFKDSVLYLTEKLNIDRNELSYEKLKAEIYKRLINANVLAVSKKQSFFSLFEEAHYRSEMNVQFLNPDTLGVLSDFKKKGGKVYLISDFYCPQSLFLKLLEHHKIAYLFDGVYSSSTVGKSKHKGTIFPVLLKELKIDPRKAMMIGDNMLSDSINAEKAGLHSFVMPHGKYLRKNKINSLGNDKRNFSKVIKKIYKDCNGKSAVLPYTEYVIFYHFFIERLYIHCKKHNIKSLFFLSREGLFLKKLFESYQEHHAMEGDNLIRTHYLKISRQASLQISLKPLEDEEFKYLRRKYHSLNLEEFLSFFRFGSQSKEKIKTALQIEDDHPVEDFFNSEVYGQLKKDQTFRSAYEENRINNREVFVEYLNSFQEHINDGINVVDIGWGGTMQEAIYNFFDKKVKVTGYYLGLNAIYQFDENTKRYGLNFSIAPFKTYNFHILRANTQLYEQFSGAGHGCCIAYNKSERGFTVEHHEENEKWLYDNFIGKHQEQMLEIHKDLMKHLFPVCYNNEMVENMMVFLAIRVGIRQNMKKIGFLETMSSGYYQNISIKKTGIDYEIPENLLTLKEFVKFMFRPELYFRYLVKLKGKLYKSNKILAYLFPGIIVVGYYRFNRFVRFKLLHRFTLLKFNYFR